MAFVSGVVLMSLSDLKGCVFTLIHQAGAEKWMLFRLFDCGKRDGVFDRSGNQMVYRANSWTAFLGDWERYRKPGQLSEEESKKGFFTVSPGDLLIFSDVADGVPTSIREFSALREKYRNNGGVISSVEVYIRYRPDGTPWKTNHIEVMRA